MDSFISAIILVITFIALIFPIIIFINLRKYKEAALGLIFNKLEKSVLAFKIYAIAILIFALGRLFDLLNITFGSSSLDDIVTLMNLITTILLIYAYYKLLIIIQIQNQKV
jgi:hypothetical protein